MVVNIQRTSLPNQKHESYAGRDFTGKVIDNKDPEKKERVKVRIKGVHDDLSDEDIPWTLADRNGSPANGGDTGSIGPIPPIGTAVKARSDDGELYNMKYSSAATGEKQQAAELSQGKDTTGEDYPNVTSSIDAGGNRTTVNTKKNTMDYEHASGTRISVDGEGHAHITTGSKKVGENAQSKNSKGMTFHIQGDANIRCTGSANIGADKDVIVVAKGNMNFGCQGNMSFFAKGNIKINGKVIDLNDGTGTMPQLKDLPAPPSRNVPKPDVKD